MSTELSSCQGNLKLKVLNHLLQIIIKIYISFSKRELRIKRAQQRLKLKIKKEHRQIQKETKSGLFAKTEVIPLSKVLPEEDIEVDILS